MEHTEALLKVKAFYENQIKHAEVTIVTARQKLMDIEAQLACEHEFTESAPGLFYTEIRCKKCGYWFDL